MASWFYTRILIVCTLAWAIIMMSYSAWQTQIFEGNWGKVTVKKATPLPEKSLKMASKKREIKKATKNLM